jgi:hypothetical protein
MTRSTYSTRLDPRVMQPALDIGFKYKILSRQVNVDELIDKAFL